MSNTKLWDALCKTDPAHTQPFKRAGGFRGTAIKPIWLIKRITDVLGPMGEKWGVSSVEFTTQEGVDDELLVFCQVVMFAGEGGESIMGFGGDKIIIRRQVKGKPGEYYWTNNDEAYKSAYTDAVGNALKFLGAGADVHMGLFDDNKYVNDMADEFKSQTGNRMPAKAADRCKLNDLLKDLYGDVSTEKELKQLKEDIRPIKRLLPLSWTDSISDVEAGAEKRVKNPSGEHQDMAEAAEEYERTQATE